jgi:GT2 family glycosyltransferase
VKGNDVKVLAIIPSIGGPGFEAVSNLQQKLDGLDAFQSIVVSNSSRLSEYLGSVSVPYVTRSSNDGFGQSIKAGAEFSKSWSWLLVVNDDVSINEDTFAETAREYLIENTGALEIIYFDVDKLRRLPRRLEVFLQVSLLGKLVNKIQPSEFRGDKSYRSFSCVAISRELFDRSGGFDDDLVFTYEDADFVARAIKLGAVQRCPGGSGVVHAHSVSSGKHIDRVLPVATYSAAIYLDKKGGFTSLNTAIILSALVARLIFVPFTHSVKSKHVNAIFAAAVAVVKRFREKPRLPDYLDL